MANKIDTKIVAITKDDHDKWDRIAEYSFKVLEAKPDGSISTTEVPLTNLTPNVSSVKLYIPPQSINIQTQFATTVSSTNGGIIEEHNGTVFRLISISGTTGVWTKRTTEVKAGKNGWLDYVKVFSPAAGAAIQSVSNILGGFKTNLPGGNDTKDNKPTKGEDNDVIEAQKNGEVGYAQFWHLYNFFVAYTEFKKTPAGKKARLIFSSPKDSIDYVVTPLTFDLRRDARSPLLYNYTISLKAWRVKRAGFPEASEILNGVDIRNPSLVKSAIETVRRARMLIHNIENVLKGFQSDIHDVAQFLSQVNMAQKDVYGLAYTALDLPDAINANWKQLSALNRDQIRDARAKFKEKLSVMHGTSKSSANQNEQSQALAGTQNAPAPNTSINEVASLNSQLGQANANSQSLNAQLGAAGNTIKELQARLARVSGETASRSDTTSALAADGERALNEIAKNAEALDSLNLDSLTLPKPVTDALASLKAQSKNITSGQVLEAAKKLQSMCDNIAAQSGMLNSSYSKIYNVPAPGSTNKVPNEDDIILMATLQESINSMIGLTVSTNAYSTGIPNPIIDANAVIDPNEEMQTPNSYFPAIVNKGDTMESIALRYLGNQNRAKEIILLNKLSLPYIDETGITLEIYFPTKRSFTVRDKTNLEKNQTINIVGAGQSSTRRKILEIEDLGSGVWKITVDGSPDLDRFRQVSGTPKLVARKLGTVGSGDIIFIPSNDQPDQAEEVRPTQLQKKLTSAEKIFRVDLALKDSNSPATSQAVDLDIDSSGDIRRSYGYENAIQAIRNAIEIERGGLAAHPQYGLPNLAGQRNSTVTAGDIAEVVRKQIVSDPRFVNAEVQVISEGSTVFINIQAEGASGTGRIPVQFRLNI